MDHVRDHLPSDGQGGPSRSSLALGGSKDGAAEGQGMEPIFVMGWERHAKATEEALGPFLRRRSI